MSLTGRPCPRWAQLRRTQWEHMFSALASNSDIARRSPHVSNVPNSDMTLIRRPQKKKPPRRRLFNTGRCGVGQRFSHVYARPTQPLQDSQRARRRVAALIGSMRDLEGLSEDVIGELGVEPHPTSGSLLPG
jgi:hypothetical protein